MTDLTDLESGGDGFASRWYQFSLLELMAAPLLVGLWFALDRPLAGALRIPLFAMVVGQLFGWRVSRRGKSLARAAFVGGLATTVVLGWLHFRQHCIQQTIGGPMLEFPVELIFVIPFAVGSSAWPMLSSRWQCRCAYLAMLHGHYEDAIADCTRAIQLDSRNAQAHYFRGKSYAALGHAAEAERDLKRSKDLGLHESDEIE